MRSLIENHKLPVTIVFLLLVSVLVFGSHSRLGPKAGDFPPGPNKEAETVPEVVLACPGRIEGASEVINVARALMAS